MDDRSKRRAPHRDHAYPRAKSQPGIPSVEIDPEKTPLPAAPPGPEAFAVLPITAKVDALHHVVQEQSAAIERVWEARHVADRLERLETIVAQDTRQVSGLIVEVQQLRDIARDAFDKSLANASEQIKTGAELGVFFNRQFPEYLEEVKTSNALLRSVQQRVGDVEDRVERVEAKQSEQAAQIVALSAGLAAVDARHKEATIRSDERRRWFALVTKFPKVVTAIIAAAIAIAGYFGITHL